MKTITFTYRGEIERWDAPKPDTPIGRCRWKAGYSETTIDGHVLYPWSTRAECRADAERQGCRAVFVRL